MPCHTCLYGWRGDGTCQPISHYLPLLASVRDAFPLLGHVFADGAYARVKLETALAAAGG